MVEIIIVNGRNGGCGKTSLSTMLTIYNAQERNRKTAGFDWNINNNDFEQTFDFFNKIDADKINDVFFRKTCPINQTRKELNFYTPANRNQLTDRDFWKYLSLLYPEVKDLTTLVVDTRVDISRIPNFKTDVSKYLKVLGNSPIKFYYILGWRYLDKEIRTLESSFKWLEQNLPDVEFIFTWNVYEQSKPRKLFSAPKIIYSVYGDYEKRLKYKSVDTVVTLTYQRLCKLMKKFNIRRVRNLSGDEIPEFWDITFRKILKLLHEKKKEVFRNWLLIPEKINMTFSTDVTKAKANKNLKEIQLGYKKFYKYIAQFERMRDRFLRG